MMSDKKFHILYLGQHHHCCITIERIINIGLAIISTGSLGGFFLWDNAQILWATILVAAQVVTAIKPYLPYAKRSQEIENAIIELTIIYEEIEEKWNDIYSDKLDDDDINILYYQFCKKWDKADAKYLVNDSLPRNPKLITKAHEENELYFKNTFGGNYNEA
jgi:hypothetical protein